MVIVRRPTALDQQQLGCETSAVDSGFLVPGKPALPKVRSQAGLAVSARCHGVNSAPHVVQCTLATAHVSNSAR